MLPCPAEAMSVGVTGVDNTGRRTKSGGLRKGREAVLTGVEAGGRFFGVFPNPLTRTDCELNRSQQW